MLSEMTEKEVQEKKTSTRLALIEQTQRFNYQTLERIERKIDALDKKIDKVEIKVYASIRWLIGVSVPLIISALSIAFEFHNFVNN